MPANVHQFLVVLTNTTPLVWRRIQVPDRYTFWDLHVAIQDAMGWLDYHLHEFTVVDPKLGRTLRIGIPDGETPESRLSLPGWRIPLSGFFDHMQSHPAAYVYDFGDDWEHVVTYETTEPADRSLTYPRCVAGERACPPEDCGGAHGYLQFVEAIQNPRHPEHRAMLQWVGRPFDPHHFDPSRVVFSDPRKRWRHAFQSRPDGAV